MIFRKKSAESCKTGVILVIRTLTILCHVLHHLPVELQYMYLNNRNSKNMKFACIHIYS